MKTLGKRPIGKDDLSDSTRKQIQRRIGILPLFSFFLVGLLLASMVLTRTDENVKMVVSEKLLQWERSRGSEPIFLKTLWGIDLVANEDALFQSIVKNDNRAVSVLLDSGISPNAIGRDKRSALRVAVETGMRDPMMLLISRNADVNLRDPGGSTPLIAAVKKNDVDLVQQLLQVGADVNGTNAQGMPPLTIAIQEQNLPLVDIFLGLHANVNIYSKESRTPLMEAILKDNPNLVTRILQNGANVNIKDAKGDNAMMYAIRSENMQIISSLMGTQINLDAKNDDGQTAMEYALKRGGKISELFSRALAPEAAIQKVKQPDAQQVTTLPPARQPAESKGTYSTVPDRSSETEEEPRGTPTPMTRLRLVGKLEGVWDTKKILTLRAVTATVKNTGEYTAEEVSVVVRIPGGTKKTLTGPKTLDRNSSAVYTLSTSDRVNQLGGLKEELSCANCFR